MTARVLRPAISLLTVSAVIFAALAVYFYAGSGVSYASSTFKPLSAVDMCNGLPSSFPDVGLAGPNAFPGGCTDTAAQRATSANPNVTTTLDIASGDLNFSSVVTFTPNGFTTSPVPVSAKVGGLESLTTLGLLNGACNTALVVDFILFNVKLPTGANPRLDTANIAWPDVDGTANRFFNWHIGSQGAAATPVTDADSDLRGDYNTASITHYPSYLLDIFDPDFLPPPGVDGPAVPIIPAAAYGGLTNVAGTWVPLYFLQFSNSQLSALPGAFSKFTPNMGQPNASILNDPSSVAVSTSSISDFCSPLNVTTMLLGQALPQPSGAAVTRATNPASLGSYPYVQYVASLRDADQDGYENAFDACAKNPNAGDGRLAHSAGNGDADADGIDNSCDSASTPTNSDVDGDFFLNRQDNCPQLSNAGAAQADDEVTLAGAVSAADFGPKGDTIGNACDSGTLPAPGASCPAPLVSGVPSYACQNGRPLALTFSSTVGNGRYHVILNVMAKCIGGIDADLDGYCSVTVGEDDTGVDGPVKHPTYLTLTHPANQMDIDGDRGSDGLETYLGTDAQKPCSPDIVSNNETPLDNWYLDFDDNSTATTLDLTGYGSTLNQYIGQTAGAVVRLDLDSNGVITTLDLTVYGQILNKRCGTFASPVSPPIPAWVQQ